jgi:hypothetical protein
MPPIYDEDPLTGQTIQDNLYQWKDDKESFARWAWAGFVIFVLLLLAFIIGWIFVARRYAFARTTLVTAKEAKEKKNAKDVKKKK